MEVSQQAQGETHKEVARQGHFWSEEGELVAGAVCPSCGNEYTLVLQDFTQACRLSDCDAYIGFVTET